MTDTQIEKLATFGAMLSKHCRNCWTGEQTRSVLPFDRFTGGHGGREECSFLETIGMCGLEDVADLQQYRLVIPGSHGWRKSDWIREIKNRLA